LLLFACWFGITVRFHFPLSGNYRLRLKDPLGIVPDCRFFCPTPIKSNYYVLYRDLLKDGNFTAWKELNLLPRRRVLDCFWNPGRKLRKSFLDVTVELANVSMKNKENVIMGSVSYLAILRHISNMERTVDARITQFAVMGGSSIEKEESAELLLLSKLHFIHSGAVS
jgi:hypothetical protein